VPSALRPGLDDLFSGDLTPSASTNGCNDSVCTIGVKATIVTKKLSWTGVNPQENERPRLQKRDCYKIKLSFETTIKQSVTKDFEPFKKNHIQNYGKK
jgi:hypothetical protein